MQKLWKIIEIMGILFLPLSINLIKENINILESKRIILSGFGVGLSHNTNTLRACLICSRKILFKKEKASHKIIEMNRKVASVILNYNSFADTVKCFQNIRSQSSVNQIIIIDNNSSSDERILLDEWFNSLNGSKGILKINDLSSDIAILRCTNSYELEIILGLNPKNQGYAAGNNIGLKIADYLGADSALIINPDIEIINPRFIEELEEALFQMIVSPFLHRRSPIKMGR